MNTSMCKISRNVLTVILLFAWSEFSFSQTAEAIGNESTIRLNSPIPFFPVRIPDGSAVVLNKDNVIAVVFITNQQRNGNTCDFEWYMRTDGKALFDVNGEDPQIQRGEMKNVDQMLLGPFYISWSANVPGYGTVRLSEGYYTGIILGSREEILKRVKGTSMLKNLRADAYGLPFQSPAADSKLDITQLTPEEKVSMLNAVKFDKVDFQQEPLSQCLKKISEMTGQELGKSFSIFIKNPSSNPAPDPLISFKAEDITLKDLFGYLGDSVGAKIEMTAAGCSVVWPSKTK